MYHPFRFLNRILIRLPRRTLKLLCALTMVSIFWLDVATGLDINVAVLYLIPISVCGWYFGPRHGTSASLVATALWIVAEVLDGRHYAFQSVAIWNDVTRLAYFLLVSWLVSAWERSIRFEKTLSRTEPLTDLLNRRGFHERAEALLSDSDVAGHPLTLAYIDLDNFKMVNDQMGHETGDTLLRTVAETLRRHTQPLDAAGRLGGDEFVVLLAKMGSGTVTRFMHKLKQELDRSMGWQRWPVTFSVGVLTFETLPATVREMVAMADGIMYRVKKNGKNALGFYVYRASITASADHSRSAAETVEAV